MKFLTNMCNAAKRSTSVVRAKVSAKSPEILLVVGAVTFVGTVIVACRQTLKCEEVLDAHQRRIDEVDNCLEIANEKKEAGEDVSYDENAAKKDKCKAYLQTGLGLAKIYAPAVALGAVSITSFGCSYHILKKRNLAISIAYGAVDRAFKEYRERVRKELGNDADQHFRYGYTTVKKALIPGKDENGNDISVKKDEIDTVPWEEGDGTLDNATFVFAPETSKYYFPDEVHNDVSIQAARNNMQIDFDMKGHLFLNDVLKALGLKEVPYGQLVGWKKGIGDPYIDFRTRKVYRKAPADKNRNPLGLEWECIYEFDFNTCGIIWDKI